MAEIAEPEDINIEDLFLELVGAFPELEGKLAEILGRGLTRKAKPPAVVREARKLLSCHFENKLQQFKSGLNGNSKVKDIRNAYLDVICYQTHIDDAVEEWKVDRILLTALVKYLDLDVEQQVSQELRRKRELFDD